MRVPCFLLAATLFATPALAAPKVVVSVVPAHAIVSAVMGETGKPELLLSGKLSEHTASFSPAQISALGKADLVFVIGSGLEAKLTQMSGSEAVNGKAFVELSKAEGVKTLAVREGGAWEAHDHDHDHKAEEAGHDHDHKAEEAGHDHDHKAEEAGHDHEKKAEKAGDDHDHEEDHANEGMTPAFDPHTWLDPSNAAAMARAAAKELSKADPENAAVYAANAEAFATSLDALSAEITTELAPVKDKPYVVFHDAYQYFEARFGLKAVGSISDISASAPSAKRLKEVRDKLAETGALCAFREPQFDDNYVRVITEGTKARTGVLDGIGADLEPGPEAYPALLRNLAKGLKDCLSG
jgi:zinc transport system substrate-binding protein